MRYAVTLLPSVVVGAILLALTACTPAERNGGSLAPEDAIQITPSTTADFDARCPEGFDLKQALKVNGANNTAIIVSESGTCIASALVQNSILQDVNVIFTIRSEAAQEMRARCLSNGPLGNGCIDYPELGPGAMLSTSELGVLGGEIYLPIPAGSLELNVRMTGFPDSEITEHAATAVLLARDVARVYMQGAGIAAGAAPSILTTDPVGAEKSAASSKTQAVPMSTLLTSSNPAPIATQLLTCDGRTILITGLTQVSPADATIELAGAHLGTFADDCFRPGETVAFYGPFANADDAFQARLDNYEATGEVITLDPTTAGRYQSGLCALQRKLGSPPKLSVDPTIGTVNSPWVAELVDYLAQNGSLARSDLGQTTMSNRIVDAVSKYQRSIGQQADGIVGEQTWKSLLMISCSSTDTPAPVTTPGSRESAVKAADLGLSIPITHPPCDGRVIIVLFSATDPGRYAQSVQAALDMYPGSSYLRNDLTCSTLTQLSPAGDPIYAVYQAVADGADACEALAAAPPGSYARYLDYEDIVEIKC